MPAKRKAKKKDSRLKRAGVAGFNKPKRTPGHAKKSHIVVAKVGSKIKTIRFGQQGAKTAGKPKAGSARKARIGRRAGKPDRPFLDPRRVLLDHRLCASGSALLVRDPVLLGSRPSAGSP